jgi:hypothetical protein
MRHPHWETRGAWAELGALVEAGGSICLGGCEGSGFRAPTIRAYTLPVECRRNGRLRGVVKRGLET